MRPMRLSMKRLPWWLPYRHLRRGMWTTAKHGTLKLLNKAFYRGIADRSIPGEDGLDFHPFL